MFRKCSSATFVYVYVSETATVSDTPKQKNPVDFLAKSPYKLNTRTTGVTAEDLCSFLASNHGYMRLGSGEIYL